MKSKLKVIISMVLISLLILFVGLFNNSFSYASQQENIIYKSATEYDYPPFSVVTDGEADGFSVELLKAVTNEMGLKIEFKVDHWHIMKKRVTNE